MIHATCRLTAKNRDQLRNPTLGSRVRATFTCSITSVDLEIAVLLTASALLRGVGARGSLERHAVGGGRAQRRPIGRSHAAERQPPVVT